VAADETASFRKSIRHTRLQSVVLDLVRPDDILERDQGKRLKEIKKDATARLFRHAHAHRARTYKAKDPGRKRT
jgi:hypothetical protein